MKVINTFLAIILITALSAFTVFENEFPPIKVKSLDGKSVNVQDYVGQGKVTVVSFWATWCSPCKRELDAIAEIYPDWKDAYDIDFLAITIDDARGFAKVPAMVASKGWEYTILADTKQELQRALNFQSVPQTFVLDETGKIIYTHSGYNPGDEEELEDFLAEHNAKSGK